MNKPTSQEKRAALDALMDPRSPEYREFLSHGNVTIGPELIDRVVAWRRQARHRTKETK